MFVHTVDKDFNISAVARLLHSLPRPQVFSWPVLNTNNTFDYESFEYLTTLVTTFFAPTVVCLFALAFYSLLRPDNDRSKAKAVCHVNPNHVLALLLVPLIVVLVPSVAIYIDETVRVEATIDVIIDMVRYANTTFHEFDGRLAGWQGSMFTSWLGVADLRSNLGNLFNLFYTEAYFEGWVLRQQLFYVRNRLLILANVVALVTLVVFEGTLAYCTLLKSGGHRWPRLNHLANVCLGVSVAVFSANLIDLLVISDICIDAKQTIFHELQYHFYANNAITGDALEYFLQCDHHHHHQQQHEEVTMMMMDNATESSQERQVKRNAIDVTNNNNNNPGDRDYWSWESFFVGIDWGDSLKDVYQLVPCHLVHDELVQVIEQFCLAPVHVGALLNATYFLIIALFVHFVSRRQFSNKLYYDDLPVGRA